MSQYLTDPTKGKGKKVTSNDYTKESNTTFDKSSAQISNLVYKTWFSRYPHCQYLIYNNGSKFKLHFHTLCDTYSIRLKPTGVKNPHTNAILEHIHAVVMNMLCTDAIDLANSVKDSDIDVFLSDNAQAICFTHDVIRLFTILYNGTFGAPD
jgi:hypothetical protein